MENLYIKIENGQIYDHPVTESNLKLVFGTIPDYYIEFRRITKPNVNNTEIAEHQGYMYNSNLNFAYDNWITRPKTSQELADSGL